MDAQSKIKIKVNENTVILIDNNVSLLKEFNKVPDKHLISNDDICTMGDKEFVIINTNIGDGDIILDNMMLKDKSGKYINVRGDTIHYMTLDDGVLDPNTLTQLSVISKEFFMKHDISFILSELWMMSLIAARGLGLSYINFRVVFDNGYGKGNYVDLKIPRETKLNNLITKYFPVFINEGNIFFNLPGAKKMKMKKISAKIDNTPEKYKILSSDIIDDITQSDLNKLMSTYIDISNKEIFIKINRDVLERLSSDVEVDDVEEATEEDTYVVGDEIVEDVDMVIPIEKEYLFKPKEKELVNIRKVIRMTKSDFLAKFKEVDDVVEDVDQLLEEYLKDGIRFDKITAVVRFLKRVKSRAKLSKKKKRVVTEVINELNTILVTYSVVPDGYVQHKKSHVRSGHWRTYKSGKKIWISKCIIHEKEFYKGVA